MENQREWQASGGYKPVFLVRIDSCQHRVATLQKRIDYGSCQLQKHNRCVVDAGRFHYPVIDIPPDTICPRCDFIFNDTAEFQRHRASMEDSPPEGHSLVINAGASVGACGSRSLARDLRQMESQTARKGSAKGASKSTDAKLHNAVLKTLCVLSQQVREVRGEVFFAG